MQPVIMSVDPGDTSLPHPYKDSAVFERELLKLNWGTGFNTITQTATRAVVNRPGEGQISRVQGPTGSGYMYILSAEDSLESALDVSASASFRSGLNSGDVHAQFARRQSINHAGLNVVIRYSKTLGQWKSDRSDLTDGAKAIIKDRKKPLDVLAALGDTFLYGITFGAEIILLLSLDISSEQLQQSLEIGGKLDFASGGGAAHMLDTLSKSSSNLTVNITSKTIGYVPAAKVLSGSIAATWKEIISYFQDFDDQVLALADLHGVCPIGHEYHPLANSDWQGVPPNYGDIEFDLDELWKKRSLLQDWMDMSAAVIAKSDVFDKPTVEKVRKMKGTCQVLLDQVDRTAKAIGSNPRLITPNERFNVELYREFPSLALSDYGIGIVFTAPQGASSIQRTVHKGDQPVGLPGNAKIEVAALDFQSATWLLSFVYSFTQNLHDPSLESPGHPWIWPTVWRTAGESDSTHGGYFYSGFAAKLTGALSERYKISYEVHFSNSLNPILRSDGVIAGYTTAVQNPEIRSLMIWIEPK